MRSALVVFRDILYMKFLKYLDVTTIQVSLELQNRILTFLTVFEEFCTNTRVSKRLLLNYAKC